MTLYVSDLDGTLLKNDASLSEKSTEILNRLIGEGVNFSYATARSFASASPIVKKLNLNCPAVTFNGVFVIDPINGEHIAENIFTKNSLETAKETIIKLGLAPIVYSYIDGAERVSFLGDKLEKTACYVNSRKGDKRLREAENYNELFSGKVFYLTIFDPEDTSALDKIFNEKNGFSANAQADTYNDTVWYEIYDKRAGKSAAVTRLGELLGADEIICFGDNKNDISMIKAANIGVAVENACDELKAAADIIIGSNEDDGVAKFIERRICRC